MCFHFALIQQKAEINLQLSIDWNNSDWQPVFHAPAFDTPLMPIVTQENNTNKIEMATWGLIPYFAKTNDEIKKIVFNTLNARSETIFEKVSFKNYINTQRCAILCSGFFEWMDLNKQKYPHFIKLKNAELFAFAGIFSDYINPKTGEITRSFSLITTAANDIMEKIHNTKKRMPLMLYINEINEWLNPQNNEKTIKDFFVPLATEKIDYFSISRKMNPLNKNNNAEILERVDYPELIFGYL